MKKLAACFVTLSMLGCQAAHDVVKTGEDALKNPPNQIMEALKTILGYLESLVSTLLGTALHSLIPF
jgi:hypothetical protein